MTTNLGPLFSSAWLVPATRKEAETSEAKRRAAFEKFHAENPGVYLQLRALALEAKASGQRVGIRLCWERLRWTLSVETKRAEGEVKLNDHHPPYFARLLMQQVPELEGYFETRGAL